MTLLHALEHERTLKASVAFHNFAFVGGNGSAHKTIYMAIVFSISSACMLAIAVDAEI